ncbi:hypothetical protein CTAYLR_004924 [Chrysophaeum taylorii]|uniref:Uncharacterized protein n=1 Tax=Chrysophaeum taylorii TaxID=2483200 RepID=A0AAD7XUF4_9STRA|nr:hypothetical protein CTAYLR_004924 [Chrysophaeum taylorii]
MGRRLNPHFIAASRANATGPAQERGLGVALREARSSGALKLANRGLRSLPHEMFEEELEEGEKFWEVCDIQSLDASQNLIESVAGEWSRLGALRTVRLSRNRLEALGDVATLPLLEVLDAGHNALVAVPVVTSTVLRRLLVPHNRLRSVAEPASRALEALDASSNPSLGRVIARPSSTLDASGAGLVSFAASDTLQTAGLARNALESAVVERAFAAAKRLSYLDLRDNRLGPSLVVEVPTLSHLLLHNNSLESLSAPRGLTVLDVGKNRFREVPGCVLSCDSIESLDVSDNDLTGLPPELGFLSALQRISLHGNPLRAVRADTSCDKLKAYLRSRANREPPERRRDRDPAPRPAGGTLDLRGGTHHLTLDLATSILGGVATLDLSASALASLPAAAIEVLAPRDLRAADNQLTGDLGAILAQLRFANLQTLDLSGNALCASDAQPPGPPNVANLDVSRNRLDAIPPAVTTLTTLRELRLSRNAITSLGHQWTTTLPNLETLDVKMNKLGCLGDVWLAPNLRVLDVSDNDLSYIPPDLGLAPALAHLVLHGNPQRAIRATDLPKDTPKLLARLRAKLSSSNDDHHQRPRVGCCPSADQQKPRDDLLRAPTDDDRRRAKLRAKSTEHRDLKSEDVGVME